MEDLKWRRLTWCCSGRRRLLRVGSAAAEHPVSHSKGAVVKRRKEVLQFTIALQEISPPIWRRVQVPASYSFWDLHVALQDAMGWKDCHLHMFHFPRQGSRREVEIGIPDPDEPRGSGSCLAGWEVPAERFFRRPGDEAKYEYDFGDSWHHTVLLEGILLAEPDASYPVCTGGERACPPEDVGGVSGYQEFLEAVLDPKHPEHSSMLQWAGGRFDAEAFDPRHVHFDNPKKRWRTAFRSR